MIRIFRFLRSKDYLELFIILGLVIASVYLDLKTPEYMSTILQELNKEGGATAVEILIPGGKMLLCTLGSLSATVAVSFLASKIGARLSKNIRSATFNKVQEFSMEDINHFSIPSLITRSTNDITQIQTSFIMGVSIILKAPILAVWAIIKIVNKNIEMSTATGIAVVALLVFIGSLMSYIVPKFKKIQKYTDDLNEVARETLTGVRVVRASNAESYQDEKFATTNNNITETNLKVSRGFTTMFPFITLIMNGLTLAIYWIGSTLINNSAPVFSNGTVDIAAATTRGELLGDTIVFSSYAIQIIVAFMMLTMIFMILPRAKVSAGRINEVLDRNDSLDDGSLKETSAPLVGSIEFKNVSYKYPEADEPILTDVNLDIKQGETVAFIGSTGSGKTTLINLIPRFDDATIGEVLIDGVNIKEYSREYLNKKIAFIPQKAVLFEGTIRSNVLFGQAENEFEESDLVEALRVACAEEFVLSKEDTYDSEIEQNGNNLSGGQKQRIAIARAIARKPEIIVFDDSFSALDYKTDKVLRANLNEYLKDTTKLIVAQRIGTIKHADQIFVLEQGKIVGHGTHKELLENCSVYLEIAESQFSEEELINERK